MTSPAPKHCRSSEADVPLSSDGGHPGVVSFARTRETVSVVSTLSDRDSAQRIVTRYKFSSANPTAFTALYLFVFYLFIYLLRMMNCIFVH